MIILLSDGRQEEALDAVRAAGAVTRERGYEVYTIGLGGDVDATLLRELATSPDMYLAAPSEDDLAAVCAELAARPVGCP